MTERVEISNAEWEVMRIVWTLGHATSKQISQVMAVKQDWKMATTKTLLGRLVNKGFLRTKKHGRAFIYYPVKGEQSTINHLLEEDISTICQMHIGQSLADVLQKFTFTKKDIQTMIEILNQKEKTAPDTLNCDCIPEELKSQMPNGGEMECH